MRMQGAGRHALKDRGLDLYETPPICVTAALKAGVFQGLAGPLWEPCAGRGAMARELRKAGFEVLAQDLAYYPGKDADVLTGIDFLLERAAPHGVGVVVTNPPFRDADRIIRHGLKLVPRVIVLLRAMSIEGERRSDLIDTHLRRYWVGIDRPPALHRDGWAGPRLHNSGAPFAWFDFAAEPRPAGQPIELRRFWWDEAKRERAAKRSARC